MRILLAACLAIPALTAIAQSPSPKEGEGLPKLPSTDVTLVDSSINACENFYQYTCGKVNAANPIPPDQPAWGAFNRLREWNRAVLRQILETNESVGAMRAPAQQKIGDFYAACMEQASSKANDLRVIEPLLAQIQAMHSQADLPTVLAAIHKSFGQTWTQGDNQTEAPVF